MPIPANIIADLQDLSAEYAAAAPLTIAASTTIQALAIEAASVVSDLDAAIPAAAGALDGFAPTGKAPAIATAVLGLLDASTTQSSLTDIRGIVGRMASNLNQAA